MSGTQQLPLSKEQQIEERAKIIENGRGVELLVLHKFPFLEDGRCAIGDSFFYNYQRNKFELEYKGNLFKIDNNVSADEIIKIVRQKISEVDLQLSY